MNLMTWAASVKADLVRFQQQTGIPALWAVAQMCHESAAGDGLSTLAETDHNYAGLKWADWEATHGCQPVTYTTWEVINGERIETKATFCKCPDWQTWLAVYGDLLTGRTYGGALRYVTDPFLYGYHVWKAGWATDPHYLVAIGAWMARLFDLYADTIPVPAVAAVAAASQPIPIKDETGTLLAEGWIEAEKTVVPLRRMAEALGLQVDWDQATHSVTLRRSPQK